MKIRSLIVFHQILYASACAASFFFGCTLAYAERRAQQKGQIEIINSLGIKELTQLDIRR